MSANWGSKLSRPLLLGIALVVFAVSWVIERFIFPDLLDLSRPQFETPFLMRTIAVLIGSALIVIFILSYRSSQSSPTSVPNRTGAAFEWLPFLALAIALFSIIILVVDVGLFTRLAQEDRPGEDTQAILLFASSGIFAWVSLRIFRSKTDDRRMLSAIGLVLAVAFFVIAMEEISWFQRLLKVETPEALIGNTQHEVNLHNFNSTLFEEIYYGGGFVLLILIPFIVDQVEVPKFMKSLLLYFPSRTVLFSSVVLAAFNYNLWNRTSIQVAIFVTGLILLYYTYVALTQSAGGGWGRFSPAVFLVAFIVIQLTCVVQGPHLIESWDITEFKELFIPLGLFSYALDVLLRIPQIYRLQEPRASFNKTASQIS